MRSAHAEQLSYIRRFQPSLVKLGRRADEKETSGVHRELVRVPWLIVQGISSNVSHVEMWDVPTGVGYTHLACEAVALELQLITMGFSGRAVEQHVLDCINGMEVRCRNGCAIILECKLGATLALVSKSWMVMEVVHRNAKSSPKGAFMKGLLA